MAVAVPTERAEEARARLLELAPDGFEEVERQGLLELAVYTDGAGEERLRRAFGDVRTERVEAGWEERWRAFHRPVRVGPLWVGPPWEAPPPDAVAVVVDPGRAFGTGAHATTRLCLELLTELPRSSLLDVGCGSGVLAIAAALLGFGPVVAVDDDPAAVEATLRNAAANGVNLDALLADATSAALPCATLGTMNIGLDAVRAIAPRLDCGLLVCSGYLARDDPAPRGFRRRERRTLDGWAADLLERA